MAIRVATVADVPGIQLVRRAVRENVLSDPGRITDEDCRVMLEERGRGWVFEHAGVIVGFGVADAKSRNIWALFVSPDHEGAGVGSRLLELMVDWLFALNDETIWLTTSPGTRAEGFYRAAGWRSAGLTCDGEVRFELARTAGGHERS